MAVWLSSLGKTNAVLEMGSGLETYFLLLLVLLLLLLMLMLVLVQ